MNAKSHREIERKFLLTEAPPHLRRHPSVAIRQGYLAVEARGPEVRLRHKGSRFFLTAKKGTGQVREEREVRLKREQFDELWPLTEGRRLRKTRYIIPWQGLVIEVDVFHGRHRGLMTAEVEFTDVETCRRFEPPPWFGRDVSRDARYRNRRLAAHPEPPPAP